MSALARTTAFAATAVLVLGGALALERPAPEPVVAAPSPSPTPSPVATGAATSAPTSPPAPAVAAAGRWNEEDLPPPRERDPSPEPDPDRDEPTPRDVDGWLIAPSSAAVAGDGALRRFTVEVEAATGLDPVPVGEKVEAILHDPRSWISTGRFRFQRVADPSAAHVRVMIATPATVDRWCATVGLNTAGWLSCQVRERAMLNVDRWRTGVPAFGGELAEYRAYLVNHEVGHVLGYGHVECPRRGALAPVMMQQSKSVGACRPNGWVDPEAG